MDISSSRALFYKIVNATLFRGLGALATIILTLVVTRNFSVQIAGQTLFNISLIMVLGQILSLGSHQSAIKLTGANLHERRWNIINSDLAALLIWILCGGLAVSVLYTIFDHLRIEALPNFDVAYSLIIASTSIAVIQLMSGALIGAKKQQIATVFLNGSTPLLAASLIAVLLIFESNLTSINLTVAYSSCALITTVLTLCVWFRQPDAKYHFSKQPTQSTRTHLKSMYPVVVAQLSTQYASQFAIMFYLDETQLAFFAAALRTALLVSFVLMAANLVVAGRFAESFDKQDLNAIDRLSLTTSKMLLAIAIPLCTLLIVFSAEVMSLFGQEYEAANRILQILVLGQLVNVSTGATSYLLSMCGQERALRKCLYITFIVSIALSFSLIPFFGFVGAAIATALSVSLQNLLANHYVKQNLGFSPLNIFRKTKTKYN